MQNNTPRSSNNNTEKRLKELAAFLKEKNGAFLALEPTEIFYLTGSPIEGIYIYITKNYPRREPLTVITRPLSAWQTEEWFFNKNVRLITSDDIHRDTLPKLIKETQPKKLYISDGISCRLKNTLQENLKNICVVKESSIIGEMRAVKSQEEIKIIKENQRLTKYAIETIAYRAIKEAVLRRKKIAELEVKRRILEYFVKIDAKPAFEPIVAFGKNTAHPHHISGNTRLNPSNDIVLIDAGCRRKNYNSDLTRTFLLGKMKQKARAVFQIVKDSQKSAISLVRAGAKCAEIDAAARKVVRQRGFGGCFIHGTGHGLGIDVHEAPSLSEKSRDTLSAGMLITVEPGIYIRGALGVRIEDVIIVKQSGAEVL